MKLIFFMEQTADITKIRWVLNNLPGSIGMSQCPGKNLAVSRAGRPIFRSLQTDLQNWSSQQVTHILCLLNDYQLRTLGVNDKLYKPLADKYKIRLIQYPIIEMSAPQEKEQLTIILNSLKKVVKEGGRVVIHCRGGIGRAGTIVCAMLKVLNLENDPKQAIKFVRKARDKRCVESRKQEDWIVNFYKQYSTEEI